MKVNRLVANGLPEEQDTQFISHRYSKMKKFILAILISNVSTVFLIEKRSEHLVQDPAGKFEVDLPSDFGERIRKREYMSQSLHF